MTTPHVLLKVLHVCALLAAPVLLLGMLAAFTYGLGLPGLLWFLALCAGYGWILFAFFHYRFGRQEELLHVLATAAEGGVPLAPASVIGASHVSPATSYRSSRAGSARSK